MSRSRQMIARRLLFRPRSSRERTEWNCSGLNWDLIGTSMRAGMRMVCRGRIERQITWTAKSFVRRNRKTALGAQADLRRWFPDIDESGNLLPRSAISPRVENEDAVQEEAPNNRDEIDNSTRAEIESFISEAAKVADENEETTP